MIEQSNHAPMEPYSNTQLHDNIDHTRVVNWPCQTPPLHAMTSKCRVVTVQYYKHESRHQRGNVYQKHRGTKETLKQ